jgi:hypothetical protein
MFFCEFLVKRNMFCIGRGVLEAEKDGAFSEMWKLGDRTKDLFRDLNIRYVACK